MKNNTIVYILLVSLVLLAESALASDLNPCLKVGVIAPLSGPLAEYGASVKNGFAIGQEEVSGAACIQFVYEDSRSEPQTAVGAYHKLVDLDKVDLVYVWGATASLALAPLAEKTGTFLVAMSVDPQVSKNREHVLRFAACTDDFAERLLRALRLKAVHRLSIVQTEGLYYNNIVGSLLKRLNSDEQYEVIQKVANDEKDFKTAIARLKAAKPEMVGVFLEAGQISTFFRQAAALGVSFRVIGTDYFESKTEIRAAGGAMDRALFVNFASSEDFRAKYLKRYSTDTQLPFAGHAYDFVAMLTRIVESPEKSSGKVSQDTFRKLLPYDGIDGKYQWDTHSGNAIVSPLFLKQIRGEQFDVVD